MTQISKQQFGKYEIQAEIGRGGFATVFRATDTSLGRDVALKILSPSLLHDDQFLRRFQQEARAVARLRHPRIVTIYEQDQIEGRYYIAMDLIPGPSLSDYLAQKGALPWAETRRIIGETAEALAYAHRLGMVHRDLKPANILLDPEMGSMLTDFGFARLLDTNDYSLSMSGGVVGTPAYIPVEIWEGRKAEPASDVYALGCTLYEMITGEKLFEGETPIAVMRLHDRGASLPTQWPPDVPPGIPAVLARMVATQPAARYADAGAFLAALETAKSSVQPVAAPPPDAPVTPTAANHEQPAASVPEKPQGASHWIWAAGGLIGILLLMFAFILGRGQANNSVAYVPTPTNQPTPPPTNQPTNTPTNQPANTPTSQPTNTRTPRPTNTPIPALQVGSTRVSPIDGMAQVYVPAGEFTMGSENGDSDEKPVHTVYLDAYWIDQTEVTNAQFAQFVAATSYETTAEQEGWGWAYNATVEGWQQVSGANWQRPQGPNSSLNGLNDHPVVQVSWFDAAAYCEWAGRRLPTEAQWEKAARGADARTYPWGNQFDGTRLNFCDRNCPLDWRDSGVNDGYEFTAPVGSYPAGASPYGALDMAGNVWEWVGDWYNSGYYQNSPARNPQGPATGKDRALRGGAWNLNDNLVRAAYRGNVQPGFRFDNIGFRCAQE